MTKKLFIVGSGITGCTLARKLADAGNEVHMFEKENNIGGLCYDYRKFGFWIQKYGPHIFHTNDEEVWSFISKFGHFNTYRHKVIGIHNNKKYNIPSNKNNNLTISEIREIIFKGYSEKMWGMHIDDIPKSILSRINSRDNFNNEYFTDKYQGVPIEGYSNLLLNMINHDNIKIHYNFEVDTNNIIELSHHCDKLFYTGNLNDIQSLKLEYRHVQFIYRYFNLVLNKIYATTNFLNKKKKYTRKTNIETLYNKESLISHTCFELVSSDKGIPCYPIPTDKNLNIFEIINSNIGKNIVLCGRLGKYKYFNIDAAIRDAIDISNSYKGIRI